MNPYTTNSNPEEEVKGGHTVLPNGMAASSSTVGDNDAPINIFVLLDHDFITEVSCGCDLWAAERKVQCVKRD